MPPKKGKLAWLRDKSSTQSENGALQSENGAAQPETYTLTGNSSKKMVTSADLDLFKEEVKSLLAKKDSEIEGLSNQLIELSNCSDLASESIEGLERQIKSTNEELDIKTEVLKGTSDKVIKAILSLEEDQSEIAVDVLSFEENIPDEAEYLKDLQIESAQKLQKLFGGLLDHFPEAKAKIEKTSIEGATEDASDTEGGGGVGALLNVTYEEQGGGLHQDLQGEVGNNESE